jgi:non-heme chloroperoxidase
MGYSTNPEGVRFYYQDHGPVDGPVVLLVSSWCLDSTMWEYQVPALVEAGYRCVAMDRRGHGRSDEPGAGYQLDTLADDLANLVEHLRLGEFAAVAASMGCAEVARMLTRHPGLGARKAVFVGTVTPCLRAAYGDEAYEAAITEFRADRPAWFARGVDAYFARPESGVSQALADEVLAVGLRVPMEVLVACQRAGTGTDVTADIEALRIPVLLAHGDADGSAPLELTAHRTMPLLRDGRLVMYPGGPHGLYVSHKERFTKDLLDFLA